MELVRFGIDRFRLFKKQVWIDLGNQTVLIGPNNEGKSSVCDAINMFFLPRSGRIVRRTIRGSRRGNRQIDYVHERDYPTGITAGRRWPTKFSAVFRLSAEDKVSLQNVAGQVDELHVVKEWSYRHSRFVEKISPLPSEQVQHILEYIYSKFSLVTIPAIREESNLGSLLEDTFNQSIHLQTSGSRKIARMRTDLTTLMVPEVNRTKDLLSELLKSFLNIDVSVEFDWSVEIPDAIHLDEVRLDDGNLTSLSLKGDGLKSVIQIALLTQSVSPNKDNLFIIEEPESHLNSAFLYRIKDRINTLSENSKVLVTTHSSVFVDLINLRNNYLIQAGTITQPSSKADIAGALGIRVQENLRANLGVLYVEGDEDKAAIDAILKKHNWTNDMKSKLDVIPASGAAKISSILSANLPSYRSSMVLLDSDKAGRDAFDEIKKLGGKIPIFMIPVFDGTGESELEDLLDLNSMASVLSEYFNRTIDASALDSAKKKFKGKWSNWTPRVLNAVGVPPTPLLAVKAILWNAIEKLEFRKESGDFIRTLNETLKNSVA